MFFNPESGAAFLEADIERLLVAGQRIAGCQWCLDLAGHYGGYGKVKGTHLAEMKNIELQHNVTLEPVYSAKMWRRFDELVASDYFDAGANIGLLHSGGLQGRRGFSL